MTLHQEVGGNAETTEADRKPAEAEKPKSAAPPMQVKRLKDYLAESFPDAATTGEAPADTAIRLLQGMSAQPAAAVEVAAAMTAHCTEQYCNQPQGHTGEHGWVNFG